MWRALTLKQPWPYAFVHGGKRVENRTWPVPPKLLTVQVLADPIAVEAEVIL